jgi:hypothetical protein
MNHVYIPYDPADFTEPVTATSEASESEPTLSANLNRGYDDPDVNYLTAALSVYAGGPAADDVTQAWSRILDRLNIPEVE